MYIYFLTAAWASILAPASMSRAATAEWPWEAAIIKGVLPAYQIHTHMEIEISPHVHASGAEVLSARRMKQTLRWIRPAIIY